MVSDASRKRVVNVVGMDVAERPIRVLSEARRLKNGRIEIVGDDPIMPSAAPAMVDILKKYLGPWEIVRIWQDRDGFYHVLIESK